MGRKIGKIITGDGGQRWLVAGWLLAVAALNNPLPMPVQLED